MRRVDRKYLVPARLASAFVEEMASTHAVLHIAGRHATTYRSTYFDTPTYFAARSHIQRRRRRWKVRHRWFVEDDLCRIEVKTKNGRGETVKVAGLSSLENYGRLDGHDLAFVESVLSPEHPELCVDTLMSSAEVTYTRATLVDLTGGTRVTLDWDVVVTLAGGSAWLDEGVVLIETKGGPVPARADRVLTRLGARQRPFSKSAAGTSLIREDIPDNDVRSLRGTALHVSHTPIKGHS